MLVIVGTGLAGYMLAKEWRKLDQCTPLTFVTESQGDFYSKPLLSTALAAKKTAEQLSVNSAAEMAEQLNAAVITQTCVTGIDSVNKTLLIGKKALPYERLVLACGARPISLSLAGDGVDDLLSVNNLEDYRKFRHWLLDKKKIAILGSGLVGCEFANDLLLAGLNVEIISIDGYPLATFVPRTIGETVQKAFAEKGGVWHLGSGAKAVHRIKHGYCVELNNGDEVTADGVLSAVGLLPNLTLAEQAGLITNKGIVVNSQLASNDPSIFALGDCAEVKGEVKQYVAPLLHCARVLASVLHTGEGEMNYPVMPIGIKTTLCPIALAGSTLGLLGEWRYEGEDKHLSALFYDTANCLRAFALSGDKTKEKQQRLKELIA